MSGHPPHGHGDLSDRPLPWRVFGALHRAMHGHRQLMARKLAERDVPPGQALCMRAVSHHDGITQRDLAEMLGLSRPTVTVMLQKLERAGLIERRADEADQRYTRIYLTDVQGTKPQALTEENYRGPTFASSDGKRFLVRGPDEKTSFYSFETRGLTLIPAVKPSDFVAGWTAAGTGLYVQGPGIPAPIDRLDLATGRRERWKEIVPSDDAGVVRISSLVVSPDGSFYAYAYSRVLSNLYLAEGLK